MYENCTCVSCVMHLREDKYKGHKCVCLIKMEQIYFINIKVSMHVLVHHNYLCKQKSSLMYLAIQQIQCTTFFTA